jgi:hypothetical protein
MVIRFLIASGSMYFNPLGSFVGSLGSLGTMGICCASETRQPVTLRYGLRMGSVAKKQNPRRVSKLCEGFA